MLLSGPKCAGHLKRKDNTKRLPCFLNYKHQFLPHHPTGVQSWNTRLVRWVSCTCLGLFQALELCRLWGTVMGCSFADCSLESRLKLSYQFPLWSFKYHRTLVFWRHTSSHAGLWKWQKMCRCNLESHRLLVGSVSSHKLGSSVPSVVWVCKSQGCCGGQGHSEARGDFWGLCLIVLAVAGWEEEVSFPCDRCWGGRARIGRFRWELLVWNK